MNNFFLDTDFPLTRGYIPIPLKILNLFAIALKAP